MRSTKIIHVVSIHCEGEVGDVIVGGVAPPPGVYPAQGQQSPAPAPAPSNAPPPQQQHAAPIDIEDTPF